MPNPPGNTINPTEFILGLNPSFVARGFSGNVKQLTRIIKKGLKHKGFSYIEVLQSCPTYNKATSHKWYMDRVYDISKVHWYDKTNIEHAKKVAANLEDKIATGVLYRNRYRKTFSERLESRKGIKTEIVNEVKEFDIGELVKKFR